MRDKRNCANGAAELDRTQNSVQPAMTEVTMKSFPAAR